MAAPQGKADEKLEKYVYEEGFTLNSRGLKLFTCRWVPTNTNIKSLIFLCHGYGMECSVSMRGTGIALAEGGFEVHGLDYEGHGKSPGLQGLVQSFDNLVDDCAEYFTSVCEEKEKMKKKRFLLGESMGGAVALRLHQKNPSFWDGAVLVAPMCKIADELKPHPMVIRILLLLCKIVPTWKLLPTQDIIDIAFKDTAKRQEVRENPLCYKGRPRLKTAYELFMASQEIEQRLNAVSLPFIVVHGGNDIVTDPSVSRLLYETASSTDKTLKLYPGMWHALTYGEPPESVNLVFADIIAWLDKRSVMESISEKEQKMEHDTDTSGSLVGQKTLINRL
ncbi:caffeoylshikimate esterase-like [Wolffia australiana]